MVNKLHYDVKFQELIPQGTVLTAGVNSGDSDAKVTGAERVAILVTWLEATAAKPHTITVHKTNAAADGDVNIPFDFCEINEATGAYGTWEEVESTGKAVAKVGSASRMFLIEVDKFQFTPTDDFATPLEYLGINIADDDSESGVLTGGATMILYGINYQIED